MRAEQAFCICLHLNLGCKFGISKIDLIFRVVLHLTAPEWWFLCCFLYVVLWLLAVELFSCFVLRCHIFVVWRIFSAPQKNMHK